MAPWYCTREDVKSALDSKLSARDHRQIDRCIGDASRDAEGLLHRIFYPLTATRTFDWPNYQGAAPWRLWLDDKELVSVSALVSGGVTIPPGDYLLRPDTGPPFSHIELDLGSTAAFSSTDTHQRAISITGVWMGCPPVTAAAGALAAAIADAVATTVDVTNAAAVGVGSILICDAERMIVTERQALDTGVNTTGAVGASTAEDLLPSAAGAVGEVLTVDSERMLVVDVVGSNRVVKRAWDGSTLAAHNSGADVFADRRLTVERGALGTTAASHLNGAALATHVVPEPVRSLTVAWTITTYEQEQAGYARTAGSGDNEREARALGLDAKMDAAYAAVGRKARARAI